MGPMVRYRTVFFDLYGTLVDIHTEEQADSTWEKLREFYADNGARYETGDEMRALFGAAMGEERHRRVAELTALGGLKSGDHPSEDSKQEKQAELSGDVPPAVDPHNPDWLELDAAVGFSRLFRNKGVEADETSGLVARAGAAFRLASIRWMKLYPGVVPFLRDLRSQGISPVLLSNAQRLFTAPELERLGIAPLFDAIFISSDFGWQKPSPAFFQHALGRTGSDPRLTLMVGNDVVNDIRGAWFSGIDSIYLRTGVWPGNDVFPAPHAVRSFDGPDYRRVMAFLDGSDGKAGDGEDESQLDGKEGE